MSSNCAVHDDVKRREAAVMIHRLIHELTDQSFLIISLTITLSVTSTHAHELQRFIQHLRDLAGRMSSSGGRGAGLGVKLLLGAGALAYGVKEATYTGTYTVHLDSLGSTDALNLCDNTFVGLTQFVMFDDTVTVLSCRLIETVFYFLYLTL